MGELRQAQVLGDDRRYRATDTVGGLVTGDDQLGALDGAQRAGQRPRGLDDVGPVQAVVLEVHGLVGPIDSALRMASVARSGPAVNTVTVLSPPSRSLISSASSTARSLISSSTASAASRSRVKSPSVSLRSDQVSGTCLIRTTMFVMTLVRPPR